MSQSKQCECRVDVESMTVEEMIEAIERMERETAQMEAEIAQFHAEMLQMRQERGYPFPNNFAGLIHKNGKTSGTLKQFSQYYGMPEIDVEKSFNGLVEKGAMNRAIKKRVNRETGEKEIIYTVSLTKLTMERPDLIGYVSLEDYEKGLQEGIEYELGLCEKCSLKSGVSSEARGKIK